MSPGRIALYVASIAAVALAVRSVLLGPLPTSVALLAFALYLALVVVGVLVPRLEMFGDVLWRGDPESGGVVLTFDDGPHPVTTLRVLELLAAANVHATFFVLGRKAVAHPDVLLAIVEGGHSVGLHGFDHDRLHAFLPPAAVAADIARTQDAVEAACGVRPSLFRPPVGQVSPRTAAGAKRAGVTLVGWSVRGFDGLRGTAPAQVAERIERGLEPGAIVLMHDAAEHDDFVPAGLDALPLVLAAITRLGLRVLPLGDFVETNATERAE